MKKKPQAKVIFFGLGGHHIDLCPGTFGAYSSLSGYENPETFIKRYNAGDYEKYDLEGAYVIDKRKILEERPSLCIKSPMCKPDLAPNTVKKFNPSDVSPMLLHGLEGTFKALAALAAAGCSGFDQVDPATYTAWWKRHGARIGIFKNGSIHWEETSEEKRQKELAKINHRETEQINLF